MEQAKNEHTNQEARCNRNTSQSGQRLMSIESDTGQFREVLAPVTRFTSRQSIALPTPLTRFIGREREVISAATLLRHGDVRLLTLVGTGGIGKTRLALAIASELDANFADGIVWVPLAPIHDPVLVIPLSISSRSPCNRSACCC